MKNIVHLKKIENSVPYTFHLDEFQKKILENIHLEFFLKKGRIILTPTYQFYFLNNTEATEEEFQLMEDLKKEHSFLMKLKAFIIYNLALYSALIETNSYFIENNEYLIICRFVPEIDNRENFELKVYTIHPLELPHNYKDKLYIGRDFVNIHSLQRKYFGLPSILKSLKEQIKKLDSRLLEYSTDEIYEEVKEEYLNEIQELVSEIEDYAEYLMKNYPENISRNTLTEDKLIKVNEIYREIKHVFLDIEETTKELEEKLLDTNLLKASKYVVKFRKDITNYINYIIIKINGRISDALNNIHF